MTFLPFPSLRHSLSAAGLDFTIIPVKFNPLRLRDSAASAPLEFLTGVTKKNK